MSLRIGARQARDLLQLEAGYVICREDAYKGLRARGMVEDSVTYERGGVEYKRDRPLPTVTRKGREALRAFVDKNGRLEIEFQQLFAEWVTVIRMDPKSDA